MNTPPQVDAIASTLAERSATHGSFSENARIAQLIKNALRSSPNWTALRPVQAEALDMIAHKLGRIAAGDPDFPDHIHDLIGYATLFERSLPPASATAPASAADAATITSTGCNHLWDAHLCIYCGKPESYSLQRLNQYCKHQSLRTGIRYKDLSVTACAICRTLIHSTPAAPTSEC